MPNTYFDSDLSGEQIEAALNAIHGVVTLENNGKVLAIEGSKIIAKSASELTDAPVLEPLSVTANGDYTPGIGVDGFNSVHVAVPGAGNIQPLSVTQNGTYTPPSGVDGYAPVTVNVSGGGELPLPSEYQQVLYIESTGTQCAYADVDVSGMIGAISARMQTDDTANTVLYGVIGSSSSYTHQVEKRSGADGLVARYGSGTSNVFAFDNSDVHILGDNPVTYIWGVTSNIGFAIHAARQGNGYSYFFKGMIYGLIFYQGKSDSTGALLQKKFDFVPCYRKSDGEIGYYERINGVFYTNVGTGTFSRGPDVN